MIPLISTCGMIIVNESQFFLNNQGNIQRWNGNYSIQMIDYKNYMYLYFKWRFFDLSKIGIFWRAIIFF